LIDLVLGDLKLKKNQKIFRALFGRARVYQLMSEFADDGDNRKLLDTSMENFELILLQNKDSEDVPDELFRWKFFFNFWEIFEKFQKFRKIP